MTKAKAKENVSHFLQHKNGDLYLDCTQLQDRKDMRKVTSNDLKGADFETVEGPKATKATKAAAEVEAEAEAEKGWD